jgi:hypothetical protein
MRVGARFARLVALALAPLAGCDGSNRNEPIGDAQSCMTCHNGSQADDYAGPGLENPHPFGTGATANLTCTQCHGGDPDGHDKLTSHVPPPPEIGDREQWLDDPHAYFNRLTLAGMDKFPDYQAGGQTWTALDYLQFVNPGDVRVVREGRGCGACHDAHGEFMAGAPLMTEMGIFSGAYYAAGIKSAVPQSQGLHEDTASDLAFRAVSDPNFASQPVTIGAVSEFKETPVHTLFGVHAPGQAFQNPDYAANLLAAGQKADGSLQWGTPLANLYQDMVATTCGDCHLGSAGANNRAGDFRSSGCSACHMPYSLGGRSGSLDPNVSKTEPVDPDDIDAPERAHVRAHRIRSTHQTLPGGEEIEGIDDLTCAGCHQGSNRTVLQYWGIRLDQNEDVRRGTQYPSQPVAWEGTHANEVMYDPDVGNHTFNGRNANQYLAFEDYDGDGRDDTPADVHHEAGLGCIDCHGSVDLHGGDVTDPDGPTLVSRMEQAVGIRCVDCHGTVEAYAQVQTGVAFNGQSAQIAQDSKGHPLDHVLLEGDGNYWLYSRLDGRRHFVPQTRDTVVDSGKLDPLTDQPLYSAKASYAMGRDDGDPSNGIGPTQSGHAAAGFSHMDSMSCESCHSSWTNTCIGCHLEGEYDQGANFSNITGERVVFRQKIADFVYQSPLFFQLGVGPDNKIAQMAANTKVFFRYEDFANERSPVFSFSDRNGKGNNAAGAAPELPSLAHNIMLAHSIRGRVTQANEGPRYCVSCHLTDAGMNQYGAEYTMLRDALATQNHAGLNFTTLQQHFGNNTGNHMNSPLYVHMVAGLGSGLFLFDEWGRPVNPLDTDPNRKGSEGIAPASIYDPLRARLDLDRIVRASGVVNGSNNHPMYETPSLPNRRDGALDPEFAGPLGATLIQRLTDPLSGIVLDSWLDADGKAKGDAGGFIGP